MKHFFLASIILLMITLACGSNTPSIPPTLENSALDSAETVYGFFPSPSELTLESVFKTFELISEHGDFVLIQQNTAWEDFLDENMENESQTRTDIINQVQLARQNNLDTIFVIDALNGLNRREFAGLPAGWEANFANPAVRTSYKNYAVWVVRNFHPRYLGLASEINTYMDAFPEDAKNFVSLYNEIYALVKAEAPETKIFVSFQWDDLNNMFPQPEEGNRQKYDVKWEQIEAFEPNLDIWAISSYPYFIFPTGAEIPIDYYSPLLSRTDKPIAIAESGFSTETFAQLKNTPEDQVAYINTIHNQLGNRLAFWVNTIIRDFNIDAYAAEMKNKGQNPKDAEMLGNFAYIGLLEFDGTPKPALQVWDGFRENE